MDARPTETLFVDDRTDWATHARWHLDPRWTAVLLAVGVAFAGLFTAVRDPRRGARVEAPRPSHYLAVYGRASSGCSPIPRW